MPSATRGRAGRRAASGAASGGSAAGGSGGFGNGSGVGGGRRGRRRQWRSARPWGWRSAWRSRSASASASASAPGSRRSERRSRSGAPVARARRRAAEGGRRRRSAPPAAVVAFLLDSFTLARASAQAITRVGARASPRPGRRAGASAFAGLRGGERLDLRRAQPRGRPGCACRPRRARPPSATPGLGPARVLHGQLHAERLPGAGEPFSESLLIVRSGPCSARSATCANSVNARRPRPCV